MVDLAGMTETRDASTAKAITTTSFSVDVIAESSRQPVLVHFLSSQSDQCRQLQRSLDRVGKAADGKIKLATMDIDTQPQIAARLGIRAVPAVYVFQRGQPVDGFTGLLPEAQIKAFVSRLVGPLADGLEEVLAEADAALAQGDAETAASIFSAILDQDPEHLAAMAGFARALILTGDLDGAGAVLSQVPAAGETDRAIVAAHAALEIAGQAHALGDLGDLMHRVEVDPDDHQARFDLALGLNGKGKREEAAEALLTIIKRDRTWNDGGARRQLLQLFEAWGLMDPVTLAARRKLSTLLFA